MQAAIGSTRQGPGAMCPDPKLRQPRDPDRGDQKSAGDGCDEHGHPHSHGT